MDRREFLKVGAAGASAMVVLEGTSWADWPRIPQAPPALTPLPDMDSYLTRVDVGMNRLARLSPTAGFPAFTGDRDATDGLIRKSLRSIYVTGMVGDLPAEGQLHPGMQKRVQDSLPEMDEAVYEMTEFLSSQSSDDLARLQQKLSEPGELGMQIFEALDDEAGRCGVSDLRRQQTRAMMTHVNWRLTKQPPSLIINEYVDKVRKVSASDIPMEARQQWIAAQASERVFWDYQVQTEEEVETPAWSTEEIPEEKEKTRRQKRIKRGGIIMGIGVVVFGIAAGLTASTDQIGWAFPGTAGVILFLIGLITLIVGLLTPSEEKPESDKK